MSREHPRSGFWRYDRAFFDEIARTLDVVAELIVIRLVDDAAISDRVFTFEDGTQDLLKRGSAVVTCDTLAVRVNSSAPTVNRRLHELEKHGFIKLAPTCRLKRGKGFRPTIVTIVD